MKASRLVCEADAVLAGTLQALAPSGSKAERTASPQVALDWNVNSVNAVRAAKTMDGVPAGGPARPLYQTEGLVYTSYVQAAVYDAVMKISHRYRLYHQFEADAGDGSLEAAVISASYHTLVFYLGDPGSSLAAKYSSAIAALPAGHETDAGVAVGRAAADDIESLRAHDGRNASVSNACPVPTNPPTPGAYLCSPPPSAQSLQTPWLASMRPFLLTGAEQVRAPAPPALDSAQYADDLAETRAYGASNSSVRTPDQRATAWFWNGNAINALNQTLRDVAVQHHMDLVDTVRLLAMGVLVTTDAGIACFDSKYHWLRWRPVTAIRADGDPADASWTPLVTTPNHPEYPSQHGCTTTALAEVIASALGTRAIDVTIPGAENGSTTLTTSRMFHTVLDLEAELVNARVWIGFHYRTSVIRGEDLGTAVAEWALARYFQVGDDEGD